MSSPEPGSPRGAIYDLGYQRYEGPRLGRSFAVWSLYVASLRTAFGIGRGVWPKVAAFGLLVLASLPALVQVLVAAVAPNDFDFIAPHEYYGTIEPVVILFVALIAVDLVGNDKRYRVLPLYFARPLARDDYVLAKIGALATALLVLTVGPQAFMFAGNWFGAADSITFLENNAGDILPILVSALLLAGVFSALGIVIAAYAERRAFAMPTIVGVMLISTVVVNVVVNLLENEAARFLVFLSPFHVTRGFTLFVFDAVPRLFPGQAPGGPDEVIAFAGFHGLVFLVAGIVYAGGATALAIRHYRGLA